MMNKQPKHHVDRGVPGSGPCAKQIVVATIVAPGGESWTSSNHCANPQRTCPRGDAPTGVGYEKCRDICRQSGHAEANVVKFAGEKGKGGTLVLTGHTYACEPCKDACRTAGIARLVVGGQDVPLTRIDPA